MQSEVMWQHLRKSGSHVRIPRRTHFIYLCIKGPQGPENILNGTPSSHRTRVRFQASVTTCD